MDKIKTMSFQGKEIISLEKDKIIYVPVKRLCENIGISWQKQQAKLIADEKFDYHLIVIVGLDNRQREMGCIPFQKLNGWLFSINAKRVKDPETRKRLEAHQEKCFQFLYVCWMKEYKKNPDWIAMRENGIDIRKHETNTIQAFIDYAIAQGSKSADKYYMIFSKDVKELVGYSCDRENASSMNLYNTSSLERIIDSSLLELMEQNMYYKEIYKQTKKKMIQAAHLLQLDGVKGEIASRKLITH